MSELDRLTRELVKQMMGRDVDDEQDGDYQIAYHYLSKAMKLRGQSEQLQGFFEFYKQKFGGGFNTDVLEITLKQYRETL
jgi:hypothetical protein